MKRIFADTSFWVAILDETDQWFAAAMTANGEIGSAELVATESILIEVLNFFSNYPRQVKKFVSEFVENILKDKETIVLLHNHEDFLKALELYKSRLDKGYSLTDCVSMNAMSGFGISDILTNDRHFEQEGFAKLL